MRNKDYKLKRPQEGYKTERERQFNQWSGVSDWNVYFKNKKIGQINYIGTLASDWIWDIENTKLKGKAFTRKDAFYDLVYTHKTMGE
jgi:hypothetical protein